MDRGVKQGFLGGTISLLVVLLAGCGGGGGGEAQQAVQDAGATLDQGGDVAQPPADPAVVMPGGEVGLAHETAHTSDGTAASAEGMSESIRTMDPMSAKAQEMMDAIKDGRVGKPMNLRDPNLIAYDDGSGLTNYYTPRNGQSDLGNGYKVTNNGANGGQYVYDAKGQRVFVPAGASVPTNGGKQTYTNTQVGTYDSAKQGGYGSSTSVGGQVVGGQPARLGTSATVSFQRKDGSVATQSSSQP